MERVLKNATSLTISGFITKGIGAFYKLFLIFTLKGDGLGVYSMVYPVLAVFLVVATNIFPVGISRYIAKNNLSKNIYKQSFLLAFILAVISSVSIIILSGAITKIQKLENLKLIYYIMAPTIFCCFFIGIVRGIFQGEQNMKVVAYSQVVEQISKLIFCALACLSIKNLNRTESIFIGIFLSEVLTLFYLIINIKKVKILNNNNKNKVNIFNIFKDILPIFLIGIVSPLTSGLISIIAIPVFDYIPQNEFKNMYGYANGIVLSVASIILVISTSIGTSILPDLTKKIKNNINVNKEVTGAIRCVIVFSTLFALIVFLYSDEISVFLSKTIKIDDINVLSALFKYSTLIIIYSSSCQIFSTILESVNKSYICFLYLLIGSVARIIALILLSKVKELSINSLLISETFGLSITALCQSVLIKKMFKLNFNAIIMYKIVILYFVLIIFALITKKMLTISTFSTIIKGFCSCTISGISLMLIYKNQLFKISKSKLLKQNT